MADNFLVDAVSLERLLSADSGEKSGPWFPQQQSMRLKLKSLLPRVAVGLRFHVAAS